MLRALATSLIVLLAVVAPGAPGASATTGPAAVSAQGAVPGSDEPSPAEAPGQVAPAAVPRGRVPLARVRLPRAVDAAARYDAQVLCDPIPRKGTLALRDQLIATYGRATFWTGRACTASTSEHFDGRALDWMRSVRVPEQRQMVDAFLAWLLAPGADGKPQAMARRLGVMYVIWNNRMIRMYAPARGWTQYRGCQGRSRASRSNDTVCHRNHVHLSLSWDGAAGMTSWWTGTPLNRTRCAAATTRARPGAGRARFVPSAGAVAAMVPIRAATVLDTAAGVGVRQGHGCRLAAGRVLYVRARVPRRVPARATSAVVELSAIANAPARLAVWSSGAARLTGQRLRAGPNTVTAVVPLASDGSIAVATSIGAADVVVRVVGYLRAGVAAAPARE